MDPSNTRLDYTHQGKDKIMDFNSSEGDSLLIGRDQFGLKRKKPKLMIVERKDRKNNSKRWVKAYSSNKEFIYVKDTGDLYYNSNGKVPWWGGWEGGNGPSPSQGGLLVTLNGSPELSASDFTIF